MRFRHLASARSRVSGEAASQSVNDSSLESLCAGRDRRRCKSRGKKRPSINHRPTHRAYLHQILPTSSLLSCKVIRYACATFLSQRRGPNLHTSIRSRRFSSDNPNVTLFGRIRAWGDRGRVAAVVHPTPNYLIAKTRALRRQTLVGRRCRFRIFGFGLHATRGTPSEPGRIPCAGDSISHLPPERLVARVGLHVPEAGSRLGRS